MPNGWMRLATGAASAGCAALLALIFFGRDLSGWSFDSTKIQNFKIVFLSIILEALPFLLIGVIISALLQAFLSDELVRKLTPRNPVAGVLFGSLLGIVLPLCECGMIPIVRRLIRKGMPAYIGMIYIVAGPIINPIVFGATLQAFRTNESLAYSRFYLAFIVSVALGFILYARMKKSPLKPEQDHHHSHHDHDHAHHGHAHGDTALKKLASAPAHVADEFFEMGKYLILGSVITALLQTLVARSSFAAVADHELLSHLFMMGFAYALSLCSTSDAFVAASFNNMFPPAALLSFLVLGPMLDLKNTLMMLAAFRKSFVLKFSLLIAALVLIGSILFDHLGFV
ncbi:permease [Cohnella terricola]|uniref:Permease n=1 Tax=Cohnella terricola TaxID=1289167 RepID=A0A559JFS7_9BACL|nr:permease [Cohnella terricola]TVX98720.1 permease [Cohnella terricola]